ncbi:LLM class F420-dependent oxidoreductase [Candidatus Solirubrobacter pratensis]|uniref:LLM class F420-dependent oxidoreductase n=1 Tax=Candidatus Solirubrobacter pratensis TaxID=1298857 RepID=UPI0004141E8A|nr:LLM class F420-dependent oxidoreductase [Candidatus Solirubrobacter pratensis]
MRIGYFLSSEEHGPLELVRQARLAEQAGFHGLWISDHYHPWIDAQGQSPFVWSTIGALAEATDLPVTTAVTCPTVRIHPAVIAQAAATSAVLLEGRFALGVGSGEALNEHILGDRWPSADVRLEMLEEAVEVIRGLWEGGMYEHHGRHYTVENARIYTLPDAPPPILVSGFGPKSIALAGRIGDGYVSTMPDADALARFHAAGGEGKPAQAGTKVCWGADEAECRARAHRLWPNEAVGGELPQVLPTPAHFEQASELVTEDVIAESVPCGPDIERHVAALKQFQDAGFDELYVQQIGGGDEAFFETFSREVLPRLS